MTDDRFVNREDSIIIIPQTEGSSLAKVNAENQTQV